MGKTSSLNNFTKNLIGNQNGLSWLRASGFTLSGAFAELYFKYIILIIIKCVCVFIVCSSDKQVTVASISWAAFSLTVDRCPMSFASESSNWRTTVFDRATSRGSCELAMDVSRRYYRGEYLFTTKTTINNISVKFTFEDIYTYTYIVWAN